MKKFLAVLLLLYCLVGCASCNPQDNDKAIKYYSKDSNYVVVVGEVVKLYPNTDFVDINFLSGERFEEFNTPSCCCFYGDHNGIAVGDIITVTTSPMGFYNGDYLRIVALSKDGVVYYTLEEGKANLLNFLENEFK